MVAEIKAATRNVREAPNEPAGLYKQQTGHSPATQTGPNYRKCFGAPNCALYTSGPDLNIHFCPPRGARVAGLSLQPATIATIATWRDATGLGKSSSKPLLDDRQSSGRSTRL